MEYKIEAVQINDYLILPSSFDWELVDQELGFKKIFKIFPEDKYLALETSHPEIFRLLTKAAAHYAFVFAIPKIKVQISNYGIQEFTQEKMKSSAWWDVRDLGLSLLKVADACFSEAITLAGEDATLPTELDFFKNGFALIPTPAQFESIYSINNSPEVYSLLQQYLTRAMTVKIKTKLNADCLALIEANTDLKNFLKEAAGFYALYYASLMPAFVFTQNAVVVQYEELPWQKSQVLDAHAKTISGQNFLQMGDEALNIILDYIKSHLTDFPCYTEPTNEFLMQARDSGIFL